MILHLLWCQHTDLNIYAESMELDGEGGGLLLPTRAVSFFLAPWDDVKSTASLPPPTPTSLPYAEELTQPLALCGGLGS